MNILIRNAYREKLFLSTVLLSLAACGGGDSTTTGSEVGSTPSSSSSSTSSATVTPITPSITVKGTAATGAGLANRPVDIKCSTGTIATITKADGSYSATVENGVLPCLVRVSISDGSFLHGIVPALSVTNSTVTTPTGNITPITELVLASLVGLEPSIFFGTFSSKVADSLAEGKTAQALSAVSSILKSGGIDLSTLGNVLTGVLIPKTQSSAGNAYDIALDQLATKVSKNSVLMSELSAAVAASSLTTGTTPPATSILASLPADLLMRPMAAQCSAFRSGTYRLIGVNVGPNGISANGLMTFDASTLELSVVGGTKVNLTSNGDCRYLAGSDDLLVSQAGLIFIRSGSATSLSPHWSMAIPEQTIAVAELAGDWNAIGQVKSPSTSGKFDLVSATFTVSSAGTISNVDSCADLKTCVRIADQSIGISVNSSNGGFDLTNSALGLADRLIAYRAGGGELMAIRIASDSSYTVWTKKRTLTLPVVDTLSSNRDITSQSSLFSTTTVSNSQSTVFSLASDGSRYVRNSVRNFSTGVVAPETVVINSPRAGFSNRLAVASATSSDGQLTSVSEFVALRLTGMGVSFAALPVNGSLILSVSNLK